MQATSEQRRCLELYNTGESMRIEAGAGTGKTTTLRYLMTRGNSRGRALYTAFGRKLTDEAKAKFPSNVAVRTNHSLAYRSFGSRWQNEGRLLGRITAGKLSQLMGWRSHTFAPFAPLNTGVHAVLGTIERFCQSADFDISARHVPVNGRFDRATAAAYRARVISLASEVWVRMMQRGDSMPITHDVYLKAWAMTEPQLGYSTILLDEAQDTTELMVGLLDAQESTSLIVVGDESQAIYGWRGSIDSLAMFQTRYVAQLTQSFRFGPAIAAVANAILANYCETDMQIRGFDVVASRLDEAPHARVVLARTNATLIGELIRAQLQFRQDRFAVVGGTADLEALVEGAQGLMHGERTYVAELADFENWNDVIAASKEDAYAYLKNLVELVEMYGPPVLLEHLRRAKGNEGDESACRQVFSTAHKAKGREFDSVRLCDDFSIKPPTAPDGTCENWNVQEGNLLYVAVTRARQVLDITHCQAALDALNNKRPVFVAGPQMCERA